MNTAPNGWHTITPRIFVDDVESMIGFLRQTFDAKGDIQESRPSEIRIGDSIIMVAGTQWRGAMSACLYIYVEDTDSTYERALAAGATSLEEPADMPYGDRRCMVEDLFGNIWQIASLRK